MGSLVASAVDVKGKAGPPTPYHGYLYHVLTRQGEHAPGGTKNYIVNGKMTEGFAFVAYPAEYRSSGVMTFIVNADGVVHQKDLGKKTEAIGKAMKEYNRDSSWQKAEGGTRRNRGQIKGVACSSSVKCFSFVLANANGALDDALAAFAAW